MWGINNKKVVGRALLQKALKLPILRNDLKTSGALYVSDYLVNFARMHNLPVRREICDFDTGSGEYLIVNLGDVEIVQPVAWEEKG